MLLEVEELVKLGLHR